MSHMEDQQTIRVLLVESSAEFAESVRTLLHKNSPERFEVIWKHTGQQALDELATNNSVDLIVTDYFLPGQDGVELTRALQERNTQIPIVFLTSNEDFDLAVEVMKLGVEDYFLKQEVWSPAFARTLLNAVERKRLKDRLAAQEISLKRLEAIRELVIKITRDIRLPMDRIRPIVDELRKHHEADNLRGYISIISDNHLRIEKKIVKLKELKSDKTVPYIKDIRMFDLS